MPNLPYDPTTTLGRVRLLATDTDLTNPIYSDDEINAFLFLEDDNTKRAAALALETCAANEALVLKRITLLDLSTDGPSTARVLLERAKILRENADADDSVASFDWLPE